MSTKRSRRRRKIRATHQKSELTFLFFGSVFVFFVAFFQEKKQQNYKKKEKQRKTEWKKEKIQKERKKYIFFFPFKRILKIYESNYVTYEERNFLRILWELRFFFSKFERDLLLNSTKRTKREGEKKFYNEEPKPT